MRRSEKNQKTVIEGWIDERIQFMLAGLMQPFEKRIERLRERIEGLQNRVQQVSSRINGDEPNEEGARTDPREEGS